MSELKKIPYWGYLSDYKRDRKKIIAAVDRVFSSGFLILGDRVKTFEREFAAFCGLEYGVGVNSGTDALFLALKALGIGAGDEVVTVANTAVPTVSAIRATGAAPVFADVDPDTFVMNPESLAEAITPKTRCVLPVHLFGQAADMAGIMRLSDAGGLFVIEDCAQAAGALFRGRRVGSFGDIGAFSFYPTKILGAFGDAGMAVTGRPDLCDKLRRLRFYGMKDAYYSEEEGYNSRLDEVQAAILSIRLERLEEAVEKRRAIAELYTTWLADVGDLQLPVTGNGRSHQFYAYTIKTCHRDKLMSFLAHKGVESKVNYPVPIHLMRGYAFLGYRPGDLPVTEMLSDRMLSLPIYPGLSNDEAARVVHAIRDYFEKGSHV